MAETVVAAFLKHLPIEEAETYLQALRDFHRVQELDDVPRIADLFKRVEDAAAHGVGRETVIREIPTQLPSSLDDIARSLRSAFNEMQTAAPRMQAMIVGDLQSRTLTDFAVQQVATAIESLKEKWHIIKKLKKENYFTDFLLLQLKAQCAFLRWDVTDQPRLGESAASGKDAGSVDLKVSSGVETVVLIEAYRLNRKNFSSAIRKHRARPEKYDHVGLPRFFFVLYYEGDEPEEDWNRYRQSEQVEDRSGELTDRGTLRIGVSSRQLSSGGRMQVFHFFIVMKQPVLPVDAD